MLLLEIMVFALTLASQHQLYRFSFVNLLKNLNITQVASNHVVLYIIMTVCTSRIRNQAHIVKDKISYFVLQSRSSHLIGPLCFTTQMMAITKMITLPSFFVSCLVASWPALSMLWILISVIHLSGRHSCWQVIKNNSCTIKKFV